MKKIKLKPILLIAALSMLQGCGWYVQRPMASYEYDPNDGLIGTPGHVYVPLGYGYYGGRTIVTTHPTTIIVR